MTQPGDIPEFEDLDVMTRGEELADEPEAPTRSSIVQPAPMALSGLIIVCVSFLSNVPIDNAIDARLYSNTENAGARIAQLAERTAVARSVIALIGLVICGIAIYLDDETDPAWGRIAARAGVVVAVVALIVYAAAVFLGATANNPMSTNT